MLHMSAQAGCGSHLGAWYCVHCYYEKESEVQLRLDQQGFVSFLPTCITKVSSGFELQPYFPRYLFSYFDVDIDPWRRISHTPGVKKVLGGDLLHPTPVPTELITYLLDKADSTGLIMTVTRRETSNILSPGDKVKVLGEKGSFLNALEGLVIKSSKERIELLVEVMNRPVKVKLPATQVQKI